MGMSENCNTAAYGSNKKRFTVYKSSIKGRTIKTNKIWIIKFGVQFNSNWLIDKMAKDFRWWKSVKIAGKKCAARIVKMEEEKNLLGELSLPVHKPLAHANLSKEQDMCVGTTYNLLTTLS